MRFIPSILLWRTYMNTHALTKKFVILATLAYTIILFLFTTVAREISISLRQHNLLGITITLSFIAAFILIGYYLIFSVHLSDKMAFAGLSIILIILGTMLMGLSVPEEKIHFLEFGFLALLIRKCLSWDLSVKSQYMWAIAITAVIGILDEVLQFFLPLRVFDMRDIALNALAAIMAVTAYEIAHNKLNIFPRRI